MDHIRAAIDKARAQRTAEQGTVVKDSPHPAERLGTPVKPTALEAWQSLPTIDVDPKHLLEKRIVTQQATAMSAPFDALRTSLLHELRTNNWRRLAITSPGLGCGKSTICVNLAFSLSRQADLRVMVIELDLRRPSLADILQLRDVNFSQVLSGKASPADHIRRYGDNLAFGVCQQTVNSAELLQGLTAAHQIDDIEARYQPDLILFDMPPMLLVDDTMAFIDQVDAALLVGASELTTAKEIGRCQNDLQARTNLIGVILNKCRYLDPAEAYGYGV